MAVEPVFAFVFVSGVRERSVTDTFHPYWWSLSILVFPTF